MKKLNTSFLFFCLLIACFCSKNIKAQNSNDSLRHYYNLLIEAKENTNFKKIYNFYNRNKEFNLQKKDTLKVIYNLRIIASIEYKLGQLYESEITAVSGLKLIDNMKISSKTIESKIGLLNHLGIIYYELKSYDRALELYDRALKIAKTKKQINTFYNNKANVYKKKKNYDLALTEFSKVYLNQLKSGHNIDIARSLDNLGLVKSKLNYEDALTNMLDALKIRQKEKNSDEIFVSYKHLAEYYLDRNNIREVNYYANKAYNLAEKAKNTFYKLEALSLLLKVNKSEKVVEYKRISDSITLAKQLNKNKFASIKYDYLEEKRKADEAKLKLVESQLHEEKEKKSKTISQAIAGFILL